MRKTIITITIAMLLTCLAGAARAQTNWPQAAFDAARSSHTSDQPTGTISRIWYKNWTGEVMQNTNYPIIVGNYAYIGTLAGKVHRMELANNGNESSPWPVNLGSTARIMHSLASDGTNIYAAAGNGYVYALRISDGGTAWSRQISKASLSASPLLYDSTVYLGTREGKFYALNTSNGLDRWAPITSGAPIVASAAADASKVVWVDEAMTLHCVSATTGANSWTPAALEGMSMRDYWPVIFDGKVWCRASSPGPIGLSGGLQALSALLPTTATTLQMIIDEQPIIQNFAIANPRSRSMCVRNLSDGLEPFSVGSVAACRSANSVPPPIVAYNDSPAVLRLWTSFRSSAGRAQRIIDISDGGLGAINTSTGRIDDVICGQRDFNNVTPLGTILSAPWEMTTDESTTYCSAGRLIIGMRADTSPNWLDTAARTTGAMGGAPELPYTCDMQPSGIGFAVSGRYVVLQKYDAVICYSGTGWTTAGPQGPEEIVETLQQPGVVSRLAFYNGSAFDGNDPAANAQDDAAIATDKQALLAGQQATFANYTSYSRGINGIMVDIQGLAGTPTEEDFEFLVGSTPDLGQWRTPAQKPQSITVRRGEGVGGSDRVTITWKDGAIRDEWLRVTVRATAATGLAAEDVFYFGNAIGDTGDSAADAQVTTADLAAVRAHGEQACAIEDPCDIDRDGQVGPADEQVIRTHGTNARTALQLMVAP